MPVVTPPLPTVAACDAALGVLVDQRKGAVGSGDVIRLNAKIEGLLDRRSQLTTSAEIEALPAAAEGTSPPCSPS